MPKKSLKANPEKSGPPPSPALLFDTINAYQKTAAIKAAIELDIFSVMAKAPATIKIIAAHCHASPRGLRILCDYLTIQGFLTKSFDRYALTPDSAVFLDRKSRAYAGGTLEFLLSNSLRSAFDSFTDSVRQGGTAAAANGFLDPDHPIWVSFARSMAPLMVPAAAGLADLVRLDPKRPTKVLDISASHGMWGFAFAKKNPKTKLVALDWPVVLEVSKENARASGIGKRFTTIAGDAMTVDFGVDYDVVLVPNFLHHFSVMDCVKFLKKVRAALRPGGTVAIVEFVPNPDRITPPGAAAFSLVMLATTPEGDAYTFGEYADMLALAGFKAPTAENLPASVNTVVLATR
jgi:ubiquinone/menaquinone biosynthesis C-methylase UbiE